MQKEEHLPPFEFIDSSVFKESYQIDVKKLQSFFVRMNSGIMNNQLSLNTVLDDIPCLNSREFEIAEQKAKAKGWNLVWFLKEDSRTYKLSTIE